MAISLKTGVLAVRERARVRYIKGRPMANLAPAGAGQGGGVPPYRFQTAGPTQYACAVAESHSAGLSAVVSEASPVVGIYNTLCINGSSN